jgi:hypothetical protein
LGRASLLTGVDAVKPKQPRILLVTEHDLVDDLMQALRQRGITVAGPTEPGNDQAAVAVVELPADGSVPAAEGDDTLLMVVGAEDQQAADDALEAGATMYLAVGQATTAAQLADGVAASLRRR